MDLQSIYIKNLSIKNKTQTIPLFLLGHIVKTHGLKGELIIDLFYRDTGLLKKIKTVFIDSNHQSLEYSLQSLDFIMGNKAIIKLENISFPDEAKTLVKKPVYFSGKDLIKNNSFFPQQLIGFELVDNKKGLLGKVEYIYPLNNQYLISFTLNGKEILIPLNEHIILNIDYESEQINSRLPDGLLEVYL